MRYVQKEGEGSLFINKDKKQDNHPDRTGSIFINGRRYRLAGWLRTSGKGEQFLSLKATPEVPREPSVEAAVRGAIKREFPDTRHLEDEIPF